MIPTFHPPSVSELWTIDKAKVPYSPTPVVVDGLVSIEGQGCFPKSGDDYGMHPFCFSAWRPLNEPIRRADLTILRTIPLGDQSWKTLIPAESVLRLRVFLSDDQTRAVFIESLPFDGNMDEFISIRDELRRPVIVSTELFGPLELDRKRNSFIGSATWVGDDVRLTLDADDEGELPKVLSTATALWDDQATWNERLQAEIVDKLLGVWNEDWRFPEEETLKGMDFLQMILLRSVSIERNGTFQFAYADGNLFEGHAILVRGNINSGKLDAHIAG